MICPAFSLPQSLRNAEFTYGATGFLDGSFHPLLVHDESVPLVKQVVCAIGWGGEIDGGEVGAGLQGAHITVFPDQVQGADRRNDVGGIAES